MSRRSKRNKVIGDLVLIGLSIVAAITLVRTGAVENILERTKDLELLTNFIGGMMFTSIFTTPLSYAVLGELATTKSLLIVASVGAFGSLMGDLIIFLFIRNKVREDVEDLEYIKSRRVRSFFKKPSLRWATPLLGAVIIASPFPDELGLALMGFSNIKLRTLIPLAFTMNFIGIILIGLVARSL